MNLSEIFNEHFEVVRTCSKELIKEAHRLRYIVYCIENEIYDPKDFPDCLEKDIYDHHSVHRLITHKLTGTVVAYVRLVLADPVNPFSRLPIEKYCGHVFFKESINEIQVPRPALAEISRFTISRKRLLEAISDERKGRKLPPIYGEDKGFPVFSYIALGLYKAIFDMIMENKIKYCYAVMESSLVRLLGRFGIYFQPIGPFVDYHGERLPCFQALSSLLSGIYRTQPEVWKFLIQDRQGVPLKFNEKQYWFYEVP